MRLQREAPEILPETIAVWLAGPPIGFYVPKYKT